MLRLPPFTYLAPQSIAEAVRLKAEHGADAMFVAGGSDVYAGMKRGQFEPKVLVALHGIEGLASVTGDAARGFSIGACVTLARLQEHPQIRAHFPALAKAAGLAGSPQLRQTGTIGGNVCLDTRCNYYNQTFEWRKAIAFCMKKDGDICRGGSRPRAAPAAAALLVGRRLTPEVIDAAAEAAAKLAKPLDNTDMAHIYRKKVARVYAKRALEEIAGLPIEEGP